MHDGLFVRYVACVKWMQFVVARRSCFVQRARLRLPSMAQARMQPETVLFGKLARSQSVVVHACVS